EAGIGRLRELQTTGGTAERATGVATLAAAIQSRVHTWLEEMKEKISELLQSVAGADARASVKSEAPPSGEALFWRRQVLHAANSVDFYANLHEGVWWTRLQVIAFQQKLRYLTFIQKVGRGETGVLTLTVYAEVASTVTNDEAQS